MSTFINNYLLLLIFIPIITVIMASCDKKDTESIFGNTPNERIETARADLYKELQSSEYGWKFVYFPRIIDGDSNMAQYTYLFDFIDSTYVRMEASNHGSKTDTSEYDVALGSTIKLRFTTYNYIDELSDGANSDDFGTGGRGAAGEFEFLYYGKDGDDLIFKTNRNPTEIRLEKATAANWGGNKEPLREELIKNFTADDYRMKSFKGDTLLSDSLTKINFIGKTLSLFTKTGSEIDLESESAIGYGVNGVIIMPAIEIADKNFYFFKWNQQERKLEAAIDDVRVEITTASGSGN
ncbi:protein of unknown function [bacterium A37T11]|nr:protein of unknown function [bacterium A37T11]